MSETGNHSDRLHALLSPSGSSRWMNCTPSALQEAKIGGTGRSVYADEGTLAHELGEIELKRHFGRITYEEYNKKLCEIENHELYSDDMPEEVDKYVSYCIEQSNMYIANCKHVDISIEDKIDLREYIDDGFGSNDFATIADETLEVVDLKYGRGVAVSAVDNSQLKLYALGAYFKHCLFYNIKTIKLTIIQPRLNSISSFELTADELVAWAEVVKEKAIMAHKGEGEFVPGDWCKFCKFKSKCRAIATDNLRVAAEEFGSPDELSEDEIVEIFQKSDRIIGWLNEISAYMMAKMMQGKPFKGYKLVQGRSNRTFINHEEIIKVLGEKFEEEKFMSEPKLLGITAIEKLLGKKDFVEELGKFVVKPYGKPTIALESDARKNYSNNAIDDFGVEGSEEVVVVEDNNSI